MMRPVSLDRRALLALFTGASAVVSLRGLMAQENRRDEDSSLDPVAVPASGNLQLQAIGALGVGHLQSTLGLIGVMADSLTKNLYSVKQVEDLMNGTINGLEAPKRMLRRLQESNISADDIEFLDRMVGVFNALQREAKMLAVYAKSRKTEDAGQFEKARKQALRKLGELTLQEELLEADTASRAIPTPKDGKVGEAANQ